MGGVRSRMITVQNYTIGILKNRSTLKPNATNSSSGSSVIRNSRRWNASGPRSVGRRPKADAVKE